MPAHKLRYLILLLILFFIFSLIVGVWSARTYLAELLITSSLKRSGLEDVTVHIQQLEQNQSQLPRFGFSLLTATGLLQIDAQDTIINYNPGELVKGRVNSLIINNLDLHYDNSTESQTDSAAESASTHKTLQPLKIIAALRLALRKYLFVDTLFINHITLNGQAFTAFKGKVFQLKSTAKNESLDNELYLIEQSSIKQSVALRLTADQLTAELRQTTADVIAAKIELTIHDKMLTGKYHIKPLLLQDWLQAFTRSSSAEIDGVTDGAADYINKTDKVNGIISFNFESDARFISTVTAESVSSSLSSPVSSTRKWTGPASNE